MATKERYINLFTDYGFKKIFGEEPNKNLLLDFLNELLKEEQGEIRKQAFEQLFDTAEIARFTPDQVRSYEKSLRHYRDMKNSLDTAFEEGRQQRELEIAKALLIEGEPVDRVARLTGLDITVIEELRQGISR